MGRLISFINIFKNQIDNSNKKTDAWNKRTLILFKRLSHDGVLVPLQLLLWNRKTSVFLVLSSQIIDTDVKIVLNYKMIVYFLWSHAQLIRIHLASVSGALVHVFRDKNTKIL